MIFQKPIKIAIPISTTERFLIKQKISSQTIPGLRFGRSYNDHFKINPREARRYFKWLHTKASYAFSIQFHAPWLLDNIRTSLTMQSKQGMWVTLNYLLIPRLRVLICFACGVVWWKCIWMHHNGKLQNRYNVFLIPYALQEVRQKELGRKAIDAKATSDRLLRESQDRTKRESKLHMNWDAFILLQPLPSEGLL